MTTNKPEVLGFFVEWSYNEEGEFKLSLDHFTTRDDYCSIFGGDCRLVPVIRLSDYEALKAECEKLRKVEEQYRRLLDLGEDFQWENIIRVDISDFPSRADAIDAAMQEGEV